MRKKLRVAVAVADGDKGSVRAFEMDDSLERADYKVVSSVGRFFRSGDG